MRLTLCIPGKAVRNVLVRSETLVKDIKKLTPNGSGMLIYSGNVLSDARNIGFYGIENNDCIIVLTPNQCGYVSTHIKSFWKEITNDNEDFRQRFHRIYDKDKREEALRLQDLCQHKSSIQKHFRSISSESTASNPKENTTHQNDRMTIYRKPQKPINKPLPNFWPKT